MFAKDGPTFFELIHQALCSTRRGYDLLAPKFDRTPFRTPDEMVQHAATVIGQADDALDLCCGTGVGLKFLRPICRRRVVGFDFSPGMLAQAKANLADSNGAASLSFIEQDVMTMSLAAEFDLVTCFGALGHIVPGQEGTFLRRVFFALKPGGRFVCYSAGAPPLHSLGGLATRVFDMTMKMRNLIHKPVFVMYYSTLRLPQLTQMLSEEGFNVDVRITPFGRHRLVVASRPDTVRKIA